MSTLPKLLYILKVVPTNEKLLADTGKFIYCRTAETILNKKKNDKVWLTTPLNIKAY